MKKRSPTTKDISLLQQLFKTGQLNLAPEFQRNAVWPRAAKAYLIDTILNDRPMPLFFFLRSRDVQTGRPSYAVIDGQQRLRAIFEYLDDRLKLPEDKKRPYGGKKFSQLRPEDQDQILNYDLIVEELSSYDSDSIKDVFVRMNKYVVKLSPQELRNAQKAGAFHDFAKAVGKWAFWTDNRVFSLQQTKRMKAVEFSAELAILLVEGPQDKKAAVDLYYGKYQDEFPDKKWVMPRLKKYLNWVVGAIPDLENTRYRKPVDLYGLIGALEVLTGNGNALNSLKKDACGRVLTEFAKLTSSKTPNGDAAQYVLAASRQTDNITPRSTRISILATVLRAA